MKQFFLNKIQMQILIFSQYIFSVDTIDQKLEISMFLIIKKGIHTEQYGGGVVLKYDYYVCISGLLLWN